MNKIRLIIQREYLTRVRKKSFIIMTIIGPILMASIFVVPILLTQVSDEKKRIAVVDESGVFEGNLPDGENVEFVFVKKRLDQVKRNMENEGFSAVLFIPHSVFSSEKVGIYSHKQPSISVTQYIEAVIQKRIEAGKLLASGVDEEVLNKAKTDIRVFTYKMTDAGDEKSSTGLITTIGFIGGALIYFFIFLYGAQVMRGVIEEKTNRIVEVIISSVKPFQLMLGKIIGIALVGLTQFLLWVVLFTVITTSITYYLQKDVKTIAATEKAYKIQGKASSASDMQDISTSEDLLTILMNIGIIKIVIVFIFYFIGGYLLYGALFAAIGSAVDNEADTQQFMLPITIPLILSFMVAQFVVTSPDGPIAFWFSVIPLTSPVVMMVRMPFGVPFFDLCISMLALVLGFLGTTWLAGKIYRTGILLYGKKPTYKEISKWLFYKG
jgi:ABC-2 type transport system permease protein